jgi:hypothetical protein
MPEICTFAGNAFFFHGFPLFAFNPRTKFLILACSHFPECIKALFRGLQSVYYCITTSELQKIRDFFLRPFLLEDSVPAVWAEPPNFYNFLGGGGSHGQRRRTIRSHSSLSMSDLQQSHVFRHRHERKESGRNRCALLRSPMRLRVDWKPNGIAGQKTLGGGMALTPANPHTFQLQMCGEPQVGAYPFTFRTHTAGL